MLVRLERPVLLAKPIELISELVTEVRIKVNEFGLSITAIDPANVAMVGFRLPKSAFSNFEADSEVLGVNLDDLKRILKRAGTKGIVTLVKDENTLKIQIEDRITRNFSLNLIEIESEDKDLPNLEYVCRIGLNSSDFVDSIEDAAVVADSCAFELKNGLFSIFAKGFNSAKAEFTSDEAEISGEDARAKYSLEYLQKFLKGSKMTEKTILNFSADHPLRMDLRAEEMEITFILAPRVENDD